MICKQCGTVLAEDAVVCSTCGAKQNQKVSQMDNEGTTVGQADLGVADENKTGQEPSEQNSSTDPVKKTGGKKKRKNYGVLIAAVLAVAVIAVCLIALMKSNNATGKNDKHDVHFVIDKDRNVYAIYDEKTFSLSDVEYKSMNSWLTEQNHIGTTLFKIRQYRGGRNQMVTASVWIITGFEQYQQLWDYNSSDEAADSVVLAEESAAAAVMGENGTLILYDGKKTITIADDASTVGISPDGKTLVYMTQADQDDARNLVIYTNGKSKTIATTDKDLEIYSVSNQGKCIYAIDDVNAQLCFIDQQGEIKELQNDISADQIWGTNLAGTEIAFCKDNSIYISAYGTEKKKLFSSQYNNMSIVNTWEGSLELENTYEDSQVLESFASHFYLSDETLYYVDQNFEKTKVADEVMEASVTEDEKTVFYAYGERRAIYKYNASTETKEKIVDYEDFYLDYFLITPDGKDLYYINKYSEDTVGLYYYDGKEAVLITDDIESIYEIFIYNGMLFYEYGEYYIDDFRGDKQREGSSAVHDLYCYQKEKKCDQIVAEGIPSSTGYGALWSTTPSLMENIYAGNNTMGYCVLDGGTMEYFVSASGTKFQSVLEINYDLNSD